MRKIKVAAMGVEHRHIFGQLKGMLDLGCECIGWYLQSKNSTINNIPKWLVISLKINPRAPEMRGNYRIERKSIEMRGNPLK